MQRLVCVSLLTLCANLTLPVCGSDQRPLTLESLRTILRQSTGKSNGAEVKAAEVKGSNVKSELDLFTRGQAGEVLAKLRKQYGWTPSDEKEILDSLLDEQHVLVRTLRSSAGKKFMSRVGNRELLLDRLDRIVGVPGGTQLIQSLMTLPDGEKYAKSAPGGVVPDLLDLLPKNASGNTRKIANYDRPTGRIYTAKAFLSRLEKSFQNSPPSESSKSSVSAESAPEPPKASESTVRPVRVP